MRALSPERGRDVSRASCPSIQPYATPPTGERATIAEALRRLYERGRALADLDASLELSRELEELFADVSDVLASMVAHHDSGIPPAPESAVFEEPPEDVHARSKRWTDPEDLAFWARLELRSYRERLAGAASPELLASLQADFVEGLIRQLMGAVMMTDAFENEGVAAAIAVRREYARLRHLAGTEPSSPGCWRGERPPRSIEGASVPTRA